MSKPFLLLASRSEDVAADDEYASLLRLGGLAPSELVRVRMEMGSFTSLDLDDYAGVILGGSPFTTSTPEDSKSSTQRRVEAELETVLAEIRRRDLPFLGLCYGVGALGRLAGGVIDEAYGEQTSAVEVRVTDAGRRDPLLHDVPNRFQAYVGHKEACTVLPPGAVLLASSDACPVQMFRLGAHQYVTQFHPEMDTEAIVTRIRTYQDSGYFPADEIGDVIAGVRAADVSASHGVLRAWIRRYRAQATVAEEPIAVTAAA